MPWVCYAFGNVFFLKMGRSEPPGAAGGRRGVKLASSCFTLCWTWNFSLILTSPRLPPVVSSSRPSPAAKLCNSNSTSHSFPRFLYSYTLYYILYFIFWDDKLLQLLSRSSCHTPSNRILVEVSTKVCRTFSRYICCVCFMVFRAHICHDCHDWPWSFFFKLVSFLA